MEESFSKQAVRTIMKFLFLQGKRPLEIHRELEGVFKNHGPSEQTVRKGFWLFQEGRTSVEDNERSGRPSEVWSPEMVKCLSGQVELLLAEDRRQTCKELTERADVSTETELRPASRKKPRQLLENSVISCLTPHQCRSRDLCLTCLMPGTGRCFNIHPILRISILATSSSLQSWRTSCGEFDLTLLRRLRTQ